MIKYIGSKRVLVPKIVAAIHALNPEGEVLDLFSGTSRVGHALKARGYRVTANDHNAYAYTLARCYVQADRRKVLEKVSAALEHLGGLPPKSGYVTKTFCEDARYFHPKNGARIDAMREEIEGLDLDEDARAVVLTSLMEAADRVDSTTGVQMAYLKKWAPRAFNEISLRLPDVLPGAGTALHLEASDAASRCVADIAYVDPPYNQHSYMGNYHVWETLVRWDKPEAYGIARKRIGCREYKSPFNSRKRIRPALEEVLSKLNAQHIVVSFNNEGYLDRADMEEMLGKRGHVAVFAFDHARYVGSRIGIYNLKGEKVGAISHVRNVEYLYVCSAEKEALERVAAALTASEEK